MSSHAFLPLPIEAPRSRSSRGAWRRASAGRGGQVRAKEDRHWTRGRGWQLLWPPDNDRELGVSPSPPSGSEAGSASLDEAAVWQGWRWRDTLLLSSPCGHRVSLLRALPWGSVCHQVPLRDPVRTLGCLDGQGLS